MKSSQYIRIGTCVLAMVSAKAFGDVNLVTNGGFETPIVPSNVVFSTYFGGQSFTGWTVGGGSVDLYALGVFPAFEGAQCVDLSGQSTGYISQVLATVPGQKYRLSFDLCGSYGGGPTIKTMDVNWGGTIVGSPTADITGHNYANPGWALFQVDVTAPSASTTLRLQSTTSGPYGPVIDAVSVVAVPEPGSLAMLAMGSVVLMRRRRGK